MSKFNRKILLLSLMMLLVVITLSSCSAGDVLGAIFIAIIVCAAIGFIVAAIIILGPYILGFAAIGLAVLIVVLIIVGIGGCVGSCAGCI